ncbi:MAG: Hsp20/alpha crystallin family protein [Planctomycetes bacterium]|nr:Hsp20/alpha crystallin family protein [Planctomycetota bacterium]
MSLIPWRKHDSSLRTFRREMDDLFHRFFEEPFGGHLPEVFTKAEMPKLDFAEDEKEFTVKAEIPGVEEKDLHVEAHDGLLTISGEKRQETKEEKKNYHRREISYGSFQRSVPLPPNAAGEKAQAEFAKGVLTIRIPKSAPSNGKKIEVKKA